MSTFITVTAFLCENESSSHLMNTTFKILKDQGFGLNCFHDSIWIYEDEIIGNEELEIKCSSSDDNESALKVLGINRTGGEVDYCLPSTDGYGTPINIIFQSFGNENVDMLVVRAREELFAVPSSNELMSAFFASLMRDLNCIDAIQFTDHHDDDDINEVELLDELFENKTLDRFRLRI